MNSNTIKNENWKPVKSNPNYQVSNLGNIKSLYKNGKSLILSPSSNGQRENDYQFIILNGKKEYIHQLVLQAFVGEKPKGYECDHKNKNKLDNSLTNLQYLTIAENRSHKGEEHPRAKMNNGKVITARLLIELGLSQKKVAELFDVTAGTISSIINKKSWSHV